jgi:hypothetical protein
LSSPTRRTLFQRNPILTLSPQPVSADAPGFCEAMDVFVVPPQSMRLYQNCLAKPKDSFFISASVHIQVISHACGLTTKDMLKMRGWVFLKKKSLGGSPCRHQSFSDSVYETRKRGAKTPTTLAALSAGSTKFFGKCAWNTQISQAIFCHLLLLLLGKRRRRRERKGSLSPSISVVSSSMRRICLQPTSVPSRFAIISKNTTLELVRIFSDCVEREYDLCIPLCDRLFKTCTTETGYVSVLHNALRAFYGVCSTSEDGMQSKKTWIDHPELFLEQVQLKFGKPGVHSSEACEEAVASNFEELMNDN